MNIKEPERSALSRPSTISSGAPASSRWFTPAAPRSRRPRLFCFAFAGGSASIYRPWIRALEPWVEVCPIELPGRWSRISDPHYDTMELLQADLLPVLSPYLGQPFSFFGYSLGGLIAFDLTVNLLQHTGVSPQHLVVSARGAPQINPVRHPLSHLPDMEFLETIERLYGRMPDAIRGDAEMRSVAIRLTRADLRLVETYVYRPASIVTCPITAFGGQSDSATSSEALQAWSSLTTGRFELQMFDGGHFFINTRGPQLLEAVKLALGLA
jgi:medium-chain acyl-[acyl-carrier-protein] hydrolase